MNVTDKGKDKRKEIEGGIVCVKWKRGRSKEKRHRTRGVNRLTYKQKRSLGDYVALVLVINKRALKGIKE